MRLFCRHHWKYKHTFAIDGRVYVNRRCSKCHVYNDLYVGEEYDAHGH
jgi:phage FluMu protein Com